MYNVTCQQYMFTLLKHTEEMTKQNNNEIFKKITMLSK